MAHPIWKDYYVTISTGLSETYGIYLGSDNTGEQIYVGTAYRKPDAQRIDVRINDICADYLSQSIAPVDMNFQNFPANIKQVFSVYAGGGQYYRKIEEVEFYYNYDFISAHGDATSEPCNIPIIDRVEEGMLIPVTTLKTMNTGVNAKVVYSAQYGGSSVTYNTTVPAPLNAFIKAEIPVGYNKAICAVYIRDLSDAKTYTILPKCHRYALYYVNELGGWDVLLIEGKSIERSEYARDKYNKQYDNRVTQERESIVFKNSITQSWELHTGWLTDAESQRMHHLMGSNNVYLCDIRDNTFMPVTITNKDHQTKEFRNDGKISYQIDVELAKELIRK